MKKRILFFIILSLVLSVLSPALAQEETPLVDLASFDPRIVIEMKYAIKENFTGRRLVEDAGCFLRKETALKLKAVQDELEKKGMGLKVYDAYRPLSAQKELWEAMPDDRYVTPPDRGPDHCRGAAVDVTLVDGSGQELDMGTDFDDFSGRSRPDCFSHPLRVLERRIILKKIMLRHGFLQSRTEWWHFYDEDWESYPVIEDASPLSSEPVAELYLGAKTGSFFVISAMFPATISAIAPLSALWTSMTLNG